MIQLEVGLRIKNPQRGDAAGELHTDEAVLRRLTR